MHQTKQKTPPHRKLAQLVKDLRPGFYGWKLVAIGIFVGTVAVGPLIHGSGVFFVALERQFGWSRSVLSAPLSLNRAVEGALLGPIEGYLVDRFGPRRMVLIGFVIIAAGFIYLSLIQSIIGYFISIALIWGGIGLGASIPLMTALNNWFVRRKTTAMAISQTGVDLAGLLVPALAISVNTFGWRPTALGLGIALLAMSLPLALIIRDHPEEYGLLPDGDPPREPSTASPAHQIAEERTGFTAKQAILTKTFWFLTICHGFSAAAALTVIIHLFPALTDIGMSDELAATVIFAYTAVAVVARVVGGIIGDMFPKQIIISICMLIQAAGIVLITTIPTVPWIFIAAALFGTGYSARIPLLTAIRGEYFGRKNFGTILGVSSVPTNIMSVTPIFAGYLYDTLGSYTAAFYALAVVSIIGSILLLYCRKPELPTPHQ